jgi:hypothetical protein
LFVFSNDLKSHERLGADIALAEPDLLSDTVCV